MAEGLSASARGRCLALLFFGSCVIAIYDFRFGSAFAVGGHRDDRARPVVTPIGLCMAERASLHESGEAMAKLQRLKSLNIYVANPIYFHQTRGVCRAHCTLWLKNQFEGRNYLYELGKDKSSGFKTFRLKETSCDSWKLVAPENDSAEAVRLQDELFGKSGGARPSDEQRAATSWGEILAETPWIGRIYGCTSAITGLDGVTLPKTIAEFGKTYRGTLMTLSTGLQQDATGGVQNPLYGGRYTHHAIATVCTPSIFGFFDPSVGNFFVAPADALKLLQAYWDDMTDPADIYKYKDNTLTIEHTGQASGV